MDDSSEHCEAKILVGIEEFYKTGRITPARLIEIIRYAVVMTVVSLQLRLTVRTTPRTNSRITQQWLNV